jgi:hypothetical protein
VKQAILDVCRPHAGQWRGTYDHRDAGGQTVDQHEAYVTCVLPSEGPYAYVQTSRFVWPDREETHVFEGILRDNRLWWETARLVGHAWVSEDAPGAMFLRFRRVDLPGIEILETIQLSVCTTRRMRTWQWLKDGAPWRRTLVDETKLVTY